MAVIISMLGGVCLGGITKGLEMLNITHTVVSASVVDIPRGVEDRNATTKHFVVS